MAETGQRAPIPLLTCALLGVLLLSPPAWADGGWSGSLQLAAVGQDVSGSEDSFRTQINLDEGFVLEELLLEYEGDDDRRPEFELRASGFGDAEPSQRLRLDLALTSPWRFELDYDRRESFFRLQEFEQARRRDDWRIERWHAGATWDGWRQARLGLDLRHSERSGSIERPIFAFGELYPLRVLLDESMNEVALTLETRNLPVTLFFEQSLAVYRRENRREAAGRTNLEGDDPELFAFANESRNEDRDLPTTRLVATYAHPRVEVVGSILYSPTELDSHGPVSEAFDVAGGEVGRVEFVDDLLASADMDSLVGNLRLGFALADSWTLRLEGDYRDTSTDATLLGQRILRVTSPLGDVFDIPGAVDESSIFDVTDDFQRLTVEWSDRGWAVWGGAFLASRDVRWRLDNDDTGRDVTRESDGTLFGVSWSSGKVSGSAEYEHGTFDDFVFRTDAETVDRLSFRLRGDLGEGWRGHLRGRFTEADNPQEVANVDRSSESWGLGVDWSSEDGETGFGIDLDQVDLATETDLVLPNGLPDVSVYDLSLFTASLHGRAKLGKVSLWGNATRLDDSGDTWPTESWIARGRVGFEVRSDLELAAFGEYWSYEEELAQLDDYDVTRYGLSLRWDFQ